MYFASTRVSWYSAHLLLKSNISLIRYLLVNLSAAGISFDLSSPPLTPTARALEMKSLACATQAAGLKTQWCCRGQTKLCFSFAVRRVPALPSHQVTDAAWGHSPSHCRPSLPSLAAETIPQLPVGLRSLPHPAPIRTTASYTLRWLRRVKEIYGFFGFNAQSRCL